MNIDGVEDTQDEVIITTKVNGHELNLKVDTGAKCNVMSMKQFSKIRAKEEINRNDRAKLEAFGGSTVDALGSVKLQLRYNSKSYKLKLYIVDCDVVSVLSLKDSLRLMSDHHQHSRRDHLCWSCIV